MVNEKNLAEDVADRIHEYVIMNGRVNLISRIVVAILNLNSLSATVVHLIISKLRTWFGFQFLVWPIVTFSNVTIACFDCKTYSLYSNHIWFQFLFNLWENKYLMLFMVISKPLNRKIIDTGMSGCFYYALFVQLLGKMGIKFDILYEVV